MTYTLQTHHKKILADTLTPVSTYLRIRDQFPNSLLLESSDYHAQDNSFSYICCNPIATFTVAHETITQTYPDGTVATQSITPQTNVAQAIHDFSRKFIVTEDNFKFSCAGLFGYIAYDAVRYFEDVTLSKKENTVDIPDIHYAVYQNIIAIDHFKSEAHLFAHCYQTESNIATLEHVLNTKNAVLYPFTRENKPQSNLTDEEHKAQVNLAKKHCQRGDVFQLVLSRRFSQKFKGDEFNVYRALRSINPSPYLFYFDYGNFKIFGSSPEAQIIVKENKAEIHPIAGTYKRTGNDQQDAKLARKLAQDDKENSEHVMLVDLARNDLSRNGNNVQVETFREVQYFSHVIHLVSKVTGHKKEDSTTMQVVADTFPAGTLSGAPKHKAMQLIERYEKTSRAAYGGAIGFMDFKGNFNHAIIIRSFLSQNYTLYYQAGGGLVAASQPESELQEVYNKLGALTKALETAETL